MTAVVTDKRPDAYGSGSIRNAPGNGTSAAVTDACPDPYASVQLSVTCTKCGTEIPPDVNMLLMPRLNGPAEPVCIPCMDKLIEDCRPYWCSHVPWESPHVPEWRTRNSYQHRCARCSRPFLGELARRYCSDRCGEAERNARRDRPIASHRERDCETCGSAYVPTRSDAAYCSPACRQKAYRQRHIRPGISDPGEQTGPP